MPTNEPMKIVIPEPVLQQFLSVLKEQTKAEQLEGLRELHKMFNEMLSHRFKEVHEIQDEEALKEEFNVTRAKNEDLPEGMIDPDDETVDTHTFTSADEIIGLLKRHLGLTN